MRIKRYLNFIREELVYGKNMKPFAINNPDNIFTTVFNSDPLKLKEFIQDKLKLDNLKFIAGGSIGLAFEWKDKVIKFTTDEGEKVGVEKMMKLAGDKSIPGFAKYFWIKEVSLPESQWRKFSQRSTAEEESKIKKQRNLRKSGEKSDLLGPEEVEKRKSESKIKRAYVICLEKLKTLDKNESEIAHLIFLLISHQYLKPNDDNLHKLKSLIGWIKSDDDEYQEEEFLKMGLDKTPIFSTYSPGLNKKGFFSSDENTMKNYQNIWRSVSDEMFLYFSGKMLNIYKSGQKLGIPTSDIHENNIGYRNDELVAFDCM